MNGASIAPLSPSRHPRLRGDDGLGRRLLLVGGALSLAASALVAQTTPPVAPAPVAGPAVRKIETASALSTEQLGTITTVRPLANGTVLVNDGQRRRLLLLDSSLAVVRVVLDSLTEVENAYGTRAGALLAAPGDSTLFIDAATYAMLIIDPGGRIARVRSVPRAQDVGYLTNTNAGVPGFDARGRLVFRINAQAARPLAPPPRGVPYIPSPPDSAFVVAIDLATRKLDTLASVRTPKSSIFVRQTSEGFNFSTITNPLPLVDDWAVTPDGTIAFLRGRDYRVEWLHADGTLTSSEKLPFPWVRLSDDYKTSYVDSARTVMTRNAQNSHTTQTIVWSNSLNKPYPAGFTVPAGYTLPPGMPRDWILPGDLTFPATYQYGCPPGVTPAAPAAPNAAPSATPTSASSAAPNAAAPTGPNAACVANPYLDYYSDYKPPAPTYRPPMVVRPDELPDYKPPFSSGAMRADADGNLWVRTLPMKPTPGGSVYDVVNHEGVLVDRIQLPSGYTLVGFAPGKVVFLSMRDAKGLHLARVRLR